MTSCENQQCDFHIFTTLSSSFHGFITNKIQRPAPSWLVSLIGRALHRYRRGQGFKSRTSLKPFSGFLSATAKVAYVTAMIILHLILHSAVHIYAFHIFTTLVFFIWWKSIWSTNKFVVNVIVGIEPISSDGMKKWVQKSRPQKNPSIISITWNSEYPTGNKNTQTFFIANLLCRNFWTTWKLHAAEDFISRKFLNIAMKWTPK